MKVYIGLPKHLIESIIWVAREFRKNPLSHIEGGCDVVIEYQNLSSFAYDWIKVPSRYISKIFVNYFREVSFVKLTKEEQLLFFKKRVLKVFARKYDNLEGYENQPFEEIWDAESATELPVDILKGFDPIQEDHYWISEESSGSEIFEYEWPFPISDAKNLNPKKDIPALPVLKEKTEMTSTPIIESTETDYFQDAWLRSLRSHEITSEVLPGLHHSYPPMEEKDQSKTRNTLNVRKEKRSLFLSKFQLFSILEQLKEVCNNGKPLSYFPINHSVITQDLFYKLTYAECTTLRDKINKSDESSWRNHLVYIEQTINNYFKKRKVK